MQFLVVARDGSDAAERRAALRAEHLAVANELVSSGHLLFGVAMLDADGRPLGSVEVVEFESRAEVDAWLSREPFVTGGVWQSVEVTPCRVGPMFTRAG